MSELLLARLAGGVFGFEPARVQGVLPYCQLTPAPEAVLPVLGVFNWRGRLVPLYDLKLRLGLGPSQPREDQLMLVTEHEGRVLALLIDEVVGVEALDEDAPELPYERIPEALVGAGMRVDLERLLREGWPESEAPEPSPGSDLLRQRARDLAQPFELEQACEELVVVHLGGELYGLEPGSVRELCPYERIFPVPGGPATLAGLMNLRGQILPVFDLRAALGLLGRSAPISHVAVVEREGELLGLALEGVLGVVESTSIVEGRSLTRVNPVELFASHLEGGSYE